MSLVGILVLEAPKGLAVEKHVAEGSLWLVDVGCLFDVLSVRINQVNTLGLHSAIVESDTSDEATPLGRQHLVEGIEVEVNAFLRFPV